MTNVKLSDNVITTRSLISNPDEILSERLQKTITFAAATTGAVATHNLFKVTGTVAITLIGICTTDLAGATATLRVGTAKNDALLIASTTATDIDANEIWHDATPDSSLEATSVLRKYVCCQDIIYKVGTAAISGGVITFLAYWTPLSNNGKVELY